MFNTACRNSHVTIQARNAIVLGQTGAGKTSTLCHLLDQSLPINPSSTDLIEISSDIYWQHNRSQKLQTVSPRDEVTGLSKAMLAHTTFPRSSSPFYTVQQSEPFVSAISTELMERVKLKFCLETTKADLTNKDTLSHKPRPLMLYQFIDCGGMPFFRNLLPQFFPSSTTVFLLVHKLTDKLHCDAQIRVLKHGELVHSQQIPSTNLKEILSWISIAHSCSSSSSEDRYPMNTLIVGTHYDELLRLCFDDESFAYEAATMATEHICRQVVEAPTGCVLDPEPIFLSNLLAGTGESPGIQMLREKLQSVNLGGKPVTVPMLWAALIVHIRELSRDTKTVVLSVTEYLSIAATYHLDRDESIRALSKFEELCLLFRMPTKSYLSNFIFIDLQWLFNSLANVLNPPDSYRKKGAFYRDWQSLQKTGFMSSQLHSHIVSRAPEVPHLHQTWISDMLQHLCLLAKLPSPEKGHEYFCPILLPPFFNEEELARDPFHYCKQIDPLYLCSITGCVPPGFLARLFTVLACHADLYLCYCTSQLSATFRFTHKKQPSESYFIRISESRGAVQLELCSEYYSVEYFKVCEVTYPIVNVVLGACRDLRKVWIHSPPFEHPPSPDSSASSPLLSLQCSDSSCHIQPSFSVHLTQVHLKPLNNTSSYVQCSLNQRRQRLDSLHASQLVWLWEFIEV